MSDFKIRVNVELDSSDIESKLKALGKDQKVEIDLKLKNLDDIKSQLNSLKTSFKNAFKLDSNFANDLNKIAKAMDKINSGGGGNYNKPKQQISNLVSEYKDLYNTVEKLQKQLNKGGLGDNSIARTKSQISDLKAEMSALYNQMSDSQKKSIDLFDAKQMNKAMVDMNGYMNKIESQADKLKKQASDIKLEFVSDSSKGELEKVLNTIDEIKSAAKSDIKLDIEVGEAIDKLNDAKDAINKIQKESNENFKEQSRLIEKQSSGKGFKGFWEDYKNSIMAYSIGDMLGDFTVDAIRGAVSTVMDLDKAFTDLRKVSDTPIEGKYYDSVRKQAIETAKEVGMSSSDVIQSVATAMQAGMGGMEQSMAVAKQAMILANVGDMNAEQAASAVSSMINAYKLDPLKEMQIQQKGVTKTTTELTNAMDMLNHASNNYAIDSAGLSNAIANVGSVLNSYGVGLGDSVGLITAANEAMQDPEKVATGLKSIAINMAGMQTSAKDGSITLNKTAKSLKEIAGIDVYANKQTGQIKNMVQILDELQGKWTTLSEEQQSALSVAIAGKTNAAVFQSLMGNYETFKQIQGEFAQGLQFGSAAAENEQYVDSISGKLNKLKETWTGIATTFIKSDFVKGALDGLNSISEVIQKIVSNDFGAFAVGFGALTTGIVGAVKGFGAIKDTFSAISKFKDVLNGTKTIGDILDEAKLAKTATSATKLGTTLGKVGTAIKSTVTELGLFSSIGATATTAVAAGFLALPFAIAGYVKYQEYATKKRMENSRQTIQSLQEEISTNQKAVDSVRDIAREYETLKSKSNRTAEEQQRYLELTRQVAEAFPELVSGYDEAGNPILALNGSLETYIRNLDRAIEKQNQLLKSEENKLGQEWKDQVEDMKKTDKELANWTAPKINTDLMKDVFTGKLDTKKLKTQLKEIEDAYQKHYDNELKQYEKKEKAKQEVNESYQNKMEGKSEYKNADEAEQQRAKDLLNTFDMFNLYREKGESGANSLINSLLKLDDKVVSSTKEMDKHAEAIDKAEEAYGNTGNLDNYTDSVIKAYEAAGKFDIESFQNLVGAIGDYASQTGDLEGANRQLEKIGGYLEGISGVDSSIWESALTPNIEPLEVAEQKLNSFLRTYGTSSMKIGKGGLADKVKTEFEAVRNLPMDLANELEQNGEISVDYIVNATAECPTPIRDLVDELVSDGDFDTEKDLPLLLRVISEITNDGEISDETVKLISETLDIPEQEVRAKFSVKADVEAEKALDEFLKSIDGTADIEKAIRLRVDGKEEAQALWNVIKDMPEDKQMNVIMNYGELKTGLRELQLLDEIPTDVIVNIATTLDEGEIQNFLKAIEGLDGKTVSAFLQADGALEALAQCETVQEMLELIDSYIATGKIEIEEDGKEKVEETKSELDEVDGKTVTADLLVETEEGNLNQTKSALVEIDGKTYLAVVNVDTGEEELVPFEGKLNELDGKTTTSTVNVSPGDTSGIEKGKEVETLPNDKQISVSTPAGDTSGIEKAKEVEKLPNEKEVKVSITQKAGNVLDSISNFFKSKTEEKISVSVQVTGKEQIESVKNAISSMQNKNISLNVSGNALSQVNQIKSALNGLQTKNISINASGSALSQINSIKSALSGIQNKNISINASGSALSQINSIKSALAGLQSKNISINASVGGTAQVNALKASISSLQGKTVSVSCSTSGTAQVNALTSAIARVNGKTVSVRANVTGTGQVNALISAINRVKSKSVTVSASVSGTGAVQGLASAIAGVRSKSVSVSVTKTVTTVQQSVGASVAPISATPMLMNTPLADIPVSASDSIIDVPVSVSASATSGFNIGNILPSLNFNINMFKNLEDALENLSTQLGIINKKAENAFGEEKVKLLQQQIPILKEQQAIQEKIAQGQREQNSELAKWLKEKGFTFDSLGNITNYNDKLLAMEQNVDSLKKKYDDLNNAEKKNESAVKSAQKAYDTASEELTKTKGYLEDYFDTNNTETLKATEKWYEYENAIIEAQNAIIEFQKELKKLNEDSGYKNVERDINEINNKLDMNEVLLDRATGEEAIKLLEERIELTKQLQKETQDLIDYENQLRDGLVKELNQYGFKFRDDGSIEGYSQQIEKLKKTLSEDEFDEVFDKVEEYLEKTYETIPGLKVEWEKFNNEILDSKDSIQDVKDEAANLLKEIKELREDTGYKNVERDINEIEALIKINEAKLNVANGKERVELLEKQIELTKQLQKETNDLLAYENERRNNLMSELGQYGFTFRDNGSIEGYGQKIEALKKTLSEDEFSEVFEKIEDYLETTYKTIPDLQAEWIELNDEIVENINELEKLNREMRLFRSNATLTSLTNQFDTLSNKLDIINSKLKYAYGVDQINLMKDSIGILNQQLDLQSKKVDELTSQIKVYQKDLGDYGFEFDDLGNITNYEVMMDWFKDTDGLEVLNDLTEEYFDKVKDLQDVTADYHDLKNAIKDAYKEQLDVTEEIEGKITDIIEKEYEKRKDEIEKYTDERIKLLEKEKKAYQDMRDEQDYEKSINEQTKEIADLQKKLETARKDNSIAGLKRQSEILKEIEEAQKKLEETTQDRIDDTYVNNIDDEIDRLEEEQEKLLASLDEKFSETNIAQMVAQAMASGVININGELKTLQDVLIQSIDESAEGYSVMADIIKNELVSNLNVALDTMQQIADINEKLGLQNFNVISDTQAGITNIPAYDSGNSKTVTIGDTIINVSGSVDDITLGKIEDMIKEENERMLKEITSGI